MTDVRTVWKDEEVLKKVHKVSDRILRRGAGIISRDAKRRVPVKDGLLKSAFKIVPSKFGDGYMVVVGAQVKKQAYYAPFVELGTPGTTKRVRTGSKVRGKMRRTVTRKPVKAKPFLRPAMKASRRKIIKLFKNALDRA